MGPELIAVLQVATTAVGAIAGGRQQAASAKIYAQLAERDAELARRRALREERGVRDRAERLRGTIRARTGRAGVTLEGSPVEVLAQTTTDEESDVTAIRETGEAAAHRSLVEAAERRFRGETTEALAYLGAGSSLLGGIPSLSKLLKS